MKTNQYIKEFFRRNKLNAVIILLVYLIVAVSNMAISWYLQVAIDTATANSNFSFENIVMIAVCIIFSVAFIFILATFVTPKFFMRALRQFKEYAFKKLLEKNIASFSKENTSTYISAFTNDIVSIETNYVNNIFMIFQYFATMFGAMILMFYYSIPMSLIVLGLATIPVIVSIITGNKLAAKETAVSEANEVYTSTVKDILSGFPVVKSFNAEAEIFDMYVKANMNLEKTKADRTRMSQIIQGVSTVAFLTTILGTIIIGVWMILNNKLGITAGMLVGFVNLSSTVVQPIGVIPGLLGQKKAAEALTEKLAKNLEHNVVDTGKDIDEGLKEGIRIDNLSYSYDGSKLALKNITGEFEAGKSYAIVGGSGSGKSTLLNLLMGSDQSYEGQISLDDNELRDISSKSLYEMLALIQQNVFIFNASIRDNITMFKAFPEEKIDRVIKLSGLDKLIKDRGGDFLCGENGNKLSGGERQRISIARSLLRNSSVLLVDEATSALDNETAYNISQSILDLKDLTRIVVTHRLEDSLLKQYDSLLVFNNGELVEEGSFDDLMGRKEYFYSLYMVSK